LHSIGLDYSCKSFSRDSWGQLCGLRVWEYGINLY